MKLPREEKFLLCRADLTRAFITERPYLSRVAFDIVKNSSITEEIIQDAYIRVCSCNCADDIQNMKSYCYQIVRNLSLDYYRRNSKENKFRIDEDFETCVGKVQAKQQTQEESIYCDEVLRAVSKTISSLSLRKQKIFKLYYLESLTQREIALQLKCSAATVNITLGKIQKALDQCEICRSYKENG